jgi:hypothetical protein
VEKKKQKGKEALGRARKTFEISGRAEQQLGLSKGAAGGLGGLKTQRMTEEFETQEVREQLYNCEVLHVGLNPQLAAPHWQMVSRLFDDKSKVNTNDWSWGTASCRMHAHVYVYIL